MASASAPPDAPADPRPTDRHRTPADQHPAARVPVGRRSASTGPVRRRSVRRRSASGAALRPLSLSLAGLAIAVGALSGCRIETAGASATSTAATGSSPSITHTFAPPPPTPSYSAPRHTSARGATDNKPTPPPRRTTPVAPAAPSTTPPPAVGERSDRVRELQARLRSLGHFGRTPTGFYGSVTASAVTAFQKKQGLPATGGNDAATWRRLLAVSREPSRADLYPSTALPVSTPDRRCMTGRVMCVSKKSRTLAWMVDGKVRSSMDVRFGSEYTPTRDGVFSVFWKSRHHVSTLYDSPMPYAMFFSGGQAVHYSSDFAARGYAGASHGCVNVRDEKRIAALYTEVRKGDKVVVY
ncbi:L,D-transpeptidase family protein [Streptomyces tsukubensis]|uniref:L,D-transpeptidase family protein n=1 Tax=Streptomyces tsukubensis TaxID=83656 RepID=UPI001D053FDD